MRELVILNSSSLVNPSSSSSNLKPTRPSRVPSPSHPSSKPAPTVHSRSPPRVGPALSEKGNLAAFLESLKATRDEGLRVPTVELLDGAALGSIRRECLRLVESGNVAQLVPFMETLSGFGFPIKELAKPSDIVRMCIEKRDPDMAVRYAAAISSERTLFCAIVNEFGKRRDLDSALTAYREAMNKLSTPNMYLCRTIIDVCGRCGDYMASRSIFEDLLNQEITPNVYVVNSLMNVNAHYLGYILPIYKNLEELGVMPDVASYNILLKACSVAGRVDLAQDIYREAKQLESMGVLKLDVYTYSTIIKVFADAKLWKRAVKVKDEMLSRGVAPNMYTWASLISACASAGMVEQAIETLSEMVMAGIEPSPECCNILINACVESCQYDRAFRLFQSWKMAAAPEIDDDNCQETENRLRNTRHDVTTMPFHESNSPPFNYLRKIPFRPTVTTYNTLMKACRSDCVRAKGLMAEMESAGIVPDNISWTILIEMCGFSGNVEGVRQVYFPDLVRVSVDRMNLRSPNSDKDPELAGISYQNKEIIDKSLHTTNYSRILKDMRKAGLEPDVIAYTNAIKVCVESENLSLAFALFRQMKINQIKPNAVTYNTLLKARTRYGSLNEIQQCLAVYQDMRKAGYKPNDYYLKQLIEEWCEGLLPANNGSQYEIASNENKVSAKPHKFILERVAAYLQTSTTNRLAVDLRGLTQVEARIVVLAVLRKIKECHYSDVVKDDMLITLGIHDLDARPDEYKSEVKDAILRLLRKDLGLEVLTTEPTFTKTDRESPPDADIELAGSLGMNIKRMASPRRPTIYQRMKVTRQSLHNWLQRKTGNVHR